MTLFASTLAGELRRQAALLDAIGCSGPLPPGLRVTTSPPRAAAALSAWRANAVAVADKALGAVFPTVRRMLGEPGFGRLAVEFRAVRPPACGDLGEWGGAFADFVEAHHGLRRWPWLADTARLDLLRHRSEHAFDAEVDLASFDLLRTASPDGLRLVPVPGTAVVESAWPLAAIDEAHRAPEAEAEAAFAALQRAIETRRGESVMIVREGWRAAVHRLDPTGVAWMQSLLGGRTLAESLDRAGAGFDFVGWLTTAVRRAWLEGVVPARCAASALERGKDVEAA